MKKDEYDCYFLIEFTPQFICKLSRGIVINDPSD